MSAVPVEVPVTTLVIDDEEMVRHLVRRMLEPDVCRVLEAGDGEAGLRLVERHRGTIDVVLTDLVMPGIDGYDILGVLAARYPELPVVCMSGFDREGGILVPFITKPFTTDTLRGALNPLFARTRRLRREAQADHAGPPGGRPTSRELRQGAEPADGAADDLVAAALALRKHRRGGARM